MVHLQPKQLRKYLRSCDGDAILVLCEYLHNVLLGHVRVKVRGLENYRQISTNKNRFLTDSTHYLTLFHAIELSNVSCKRVYFDSQKSVYEVATIFLENSK